MLMVSSMVCMGSGAGILAAGSGESGFPGLMIKGRPVKVLGSQLARQGFALAVREGERYALMGPSGVGKALVVAALLGLQYCARQHGVVL